ncbi:hypothetical protein KDA_02490 [Dictyobacter alpinus]|uniref:Uncharacterized protein n=1 Tax=Dictyobacter alpinus TaxID=2014873 RepID=A0A402B085_9CHLR|nr:hypothetical protein [Dictyobacter alpinus]GCE24765.1 hypothetical protein KDA_02490 [Dictyobacter alpinus]
MFSSEEVTQTTEALEKLPRTFDHRSALNERRQHILQQKQQADKNTDALPALGTEPSTNRFAWRQMVMLREENRRLQANLDEVRSEVQRLNQEKAQLQSRFETDIAVIHDGQQQEISHYQTHLLELMDERNHLAEEYAALNAMQQDLLQSFEHTVAEQVQIHISEIAQTLTDTSAAIPEPLRQFVQAVEMKSRADGDRYLAETIHLKREVERMAETLDEERRLLDEERQRVVALQFSISEQSHLRQKVMSQRLRARWKAIAIFTTCGLLTLLVVLQFVCLALLHVPLVASITLSLLLPIILGGLLALLLASPPLQFLKHAYHSAPRRKKIATS